jgi:hypothetical protein
VKESGHCPSSIVAPAAKFGGNKNSNCNPNPGGGDSDWPGNFEPSDELLRECTVRCTGCRQLRMPAAAAANPRYRHHRKKLIVEFFCGQHAVSECFERHGWQAVTGERSSRQLL